MDVKVYDAVKIPEEEWDATPQDKRGYVEQYRKDGFVYGINEINKLAEDIELAYEPYKRLQDRYRKLTGKEYQWLK